MKILCKLLPVLIFFVSCSSSNDDDPYRIQCETRFLNQIISNHTDEIIENDFTDEFVDSLLFQMEVELYQLCEYVKIDDEECQDRREKFKTLADYSIQSNLNDEEYVKSTKLGFFSSSLRTCFDLEVMNN